MPSLRILSVFLVVLVLLPAGILAWLGFRAGRTIEAESEAGIRAELEAAEREVLLAARETGARQDARLHALLDRVGESVRRRMPLEEPRWKAWLDARTRLRQGLGMVLVEEAGRSVWVHGLLGLRILDLRGRGVVPPAFDPEDLPPRGASWDAVLHDLRRRADRLVFGDGDEDAAARLWEEARDRFPTERLRRTVDVEIALLRSRGSAERAAARVEDLLAAWSPAGLDAVGRSGVLLWLRSVPARPASGRELFRFRERLGLLGVPLTEAERHAVRRDALRAALEDDRTLEGGKILLVDSDPLAWPPRFRDASFVLGADLGGGARLEAELSEAWAWAAFEKELRKGLALGPIALRVAPAPGAGPAWGGGRARYLLTHRGAPALARAAALRRRWTGVGVAALLALMLFGLGLVGRAVRRERQVARLRDAFVANVSHELRTPLASVLLHADLLAEPGLSAQRREQLARVARAEGARLGALVEDLLDFGALESGQRTLEPEPVDLAAALRGAASPYEALAEQEGVLLTVEAPAEEVAALADPHALQRILANLLSNAWRHGRPSRDGNPGRIRARVGVEADGAGIVEVADDGRGIPPEEREWVFERFHRGAASSAVRGTGLGLALSRALAHEMGGALTLRPSDRETVFRLRLPPAPVLAEDRGA